MGLVTANPERCDRSACGTATSSLERGTCLHGHLFDEANTHLTATGSPICRTCRRERMRAYTARKATA